MIKYEIPKNIQFYSNPENPESLVALLDIE